jgi:hypothetical protein
VLGVRIERSGSYAILAGGVVLPGPHHLTVRDGDLRLRERLTVVHKFVIFQPLCHNLKLIEHLGVVSLLEGIEFTVVGLALAKDTGVGLVLKAALEDPLAVDEAYVAELKDLQLADWAADLVDFPGHLENSEAPGHSEQLLESFTLRVLAVGKPGHAVCHLPEPGRVLFPRDAVHIAEGIKREVESN